MIITIQDLKWSNWFSYGENNYINFEQPVLQVMGLNGTGKTSIPIILQEVFYGKNSKGKKKASLANRYLDKPSVLAESNFIDNRGNKYKIVFSRKSALKLQLFKNGIDISSHTSTNTYKTIEGILGLDFKTFSQLTYQSSTDNLEFLTATDANRKKFLITLFNLNKYLAIHEIFKVASSKLNIKLVSINSKLNMLEAWISKHSEEDLVEKPLLVVPDMPTEDIEKSTALNIALTNIAITNKKINSNNTYKKMLQDLDTSALYYSGKVDKDKKIKLINTGKSIKSELIGYETHIKLLISNKLTINKLGSSCPSCKQVITDELKNEMLLVIENEIDSITDTCIELNETIVTIRNDLREIQDVELKLNEKENVSIEIERLNSYIDESIDHDTLDELDIKSSIKELTTRISSIKEKITSISSDNNAAAAHNSRINVIIEQLDNHKIELEELGKQSAIINSTYNSTEIIKKAYSPSGLLSYKIDYLVKDLEKEINLYLGILSGGKFQLVFKLEKEKLNIEIIDDGLSVSIEELSAGELARINAATLLAIRKLMAAISSTKINILFLDEIMGVLDEGGKEMLIEVLHNEKNLNTMLVSHEYSHPLIPKITITKINKISSIDNE